MQLAKRLSLGRRWATPLLRQVPCRQALTAASPHVNEGTARATLTHLKAEDYSTFLFDCDGMEPFISSFRKMLLFNTLEYSIIRVMLQLVMRHRGTLAW